MSSDVNIKNKKASYEYEFIDKYVAGIQLTGSEIKSIRNNKASIVEAYCIVYDHEIFVKNMYIAEYDKASYNNHEPRRTRKLLLNRNEIDKLERKKKDVGLTIIPIRLFINKSGYAKLEIALARGKKMHDKREDLKSKDAKRQMDRAMKY